MIYAVDFDGTLSMGEWPEVGPANYTLIEFLKRKQSEGDKLILWTCRAGEPLERAVSFCKDNGLYFDAVNDNLPETIEKYGSNSRKITCDVYIDDRACQVSSEDGFSNGNSLLKADMAYYGGEVDLLRIEMALTMYAERIAMAG